MWNLKSMFTYNQTNSQLNNVYIMPGKSLGLWLHCCKQCYFIYRENCTTESSYRHVTIYIQRLTCHGRAPTYIWPCEWRMVLRCCCAHQLTEKQERSPGA